MTDQTATPDLFADLLRLQEQAMDAFLSPLKPMLESVGPSSDPTAEQTSSAPFVAEAGHFADLGRRMQALWLSFGASQAERAMEAMHAQPGLVASDKWLDGLEAFYSHLPMATPETQTKFWDDGLALWRGVMGQFGAGAYGAENGAGDKADPAEAIFPRIDPRFEDPRWRANPYFALVHQTYLLVSEQVLALAEEVEGLPPERKEQLRFATRTMLDAMSPANFALTNPLVLERMMETRGESVVKGLEHLVADLGRGQLTHSDSSRFQLGENIAATPGKVVLETELFQLIQYSPTTDKVLATPLVIFPPWINRFYILDLNPKKSFVSWAVAQGLTVFIVSWKSADASMADVMWDDYIRAQIQAIDFVRDRLKVPAVHTIGYCVAGTTLAATLAVLARRGEADKVASVTFLTTQVDFELAGDLRHFIDDQQIEAQAALASDGYLDGRYLAATFNLLRGRELIWNYVVRNYLLGEEYPSFDLLFWNGDVTNLPARWHRSYLEQLYRDNLLVKPDALVADDTPIDLTRIVTPAYVQAGREDHIAPPESVYRMLRYLKGPTRFVLAGSGHIAGVVNPPEARRYQYWTAEQPARSLAEFVATATEHPGSWWNDWAAWLATLDPASVPATGKRKPGGKGDKVIEEAPGSYVRQR